MKRFTTPGERAPTPRPERPRIEINGRFLDKIKTRIEYDWERPGVSYLQMPAEHHLAKVQADAVLLRMPMITAMQLYHEGILPSDRSVPITLSIGGEALGEFQVEWLRCSDRLDAIPIVWIRLVAAKQPDKS